MKEFIFVLGKSWESGFFFEIRSGIFRIDEYEKVLMALKGISAHPMNSMEKELITLIWIIPTFVTWQKDRLLSNGMDDELYTAIYNSLYNECENILGIP